MLALDINLSDRSSHNQRTASKSQSIDTFLELEFTPEILDPSFLGQHRIVGLVAEHAAAEQ